VMKHARSAAVERVQWQSKLTSDKMHDYEKNGLSRYPSNLIRYDHTIKINLTRLSQQKAQKPCPWFRIFSKYQRIIHADPNILQSEQQ
jgi:hypothetical protein